MLSFAHLDACRVRIAWEFLVRVCREMFCLGPSIHTSGSLATARPARTTAGTGTHHLTAGFSWSGAVYRGRSVTPSSSGCNRWSTPRHHSTSRRIQNHKVPPEIHPRPRNVERMDWSELDHCNSSRLFSSAHSYQTQNRRARTYYSGHQNQINLEDSDVRGMTNPPVLL